MYGNVFRNCTFFVISKMVVIMQIAIKSNYKSVKRVLYFHG